MGKTVLYHALAGLVAVWVLNGAIPVDAKTPDAFPPDPLQIVSVDPLLPSEPLTGSVRTRFIATLDALNADATALMKTGQTQAAFELWYRELRLRRALSPLEEIQALARVGTIAWENNQTPPLRSISARLQKIQAAPSQSAPERAAQSTALGIAYQQIRAPQLALSIYNAERNSAQQQGNRPQESNALDTIGGLHLDWFQYPKAAVAYQELLQLLRGGDSGSDPSQNALTLLQLAYTYEQNNQPAEAAKALDQLVKLYVNQPEVLPALQFRLAQNYDQSNQYEAAELNYKQVYNLSQSLNPSSYTSDSMHNLGAMYRRWNRPDSAQQVFDFLIDYEIARFDVYRAMQAADQLGQVHLDRKDYPRAIVAFQKGLTYAQQLTLRPEYFTQKITQTEKLDTN